MKKIFLIIIAIVLVVGLVACDKEKTIEQETKVESEEKLATNDKYKNVEKNPIVTMTMEDDRVVTIELYPKVAPQTVENFISLINKGFYNGLIFHRVIPGFMAQGGDSEGNGTGGPGYSIYGEFSANGFKNDLSHDVGVLSMARANDYNSAGSQFFIVTDDYAKKDLDGIYAAFGKVIDGMDVVMDIVNSEVIRRDYSDEFYAAYFAAGQVIEKGTDLFDQYYKETLEINRPINPPVIKSITVDTFGYTYDEPTSYTK